VNNFIGILFSKPMVVRESTETTIGLANSLAGDVALWVAKNRLRDVPCVGTWVRELHVVRQGVGQ